MVQNNAATVAMLPFETQAAFCPRITHSSPSFVAMQFARILGSSKCG